MSENYLFQLKLEIRNTLGKPFENEIELINKSHEWAISTVESVKQKNFIPNDWIF